jgi:hypothetical protein
MATQQADKTLEKQLAKMIAKPFDDMTVVVKHSDRWDRMCVTFTWKGFAGLLTEERFQRLTAVIPDDFRKKHMKGFVWLELTPGEKIDDALKSPRSEDIAEREGEIYAPLEKINFFDALTQALDGDPLKNCPGDFSKTASVLKKKKYTAKKIVEAKLVFIRRGAYCDCQVITTIRSELQKAHGNCS